VNTESEGQVGSSEVEHLPSVCMALNSIPSTGEKKDQICAFQLKILNLLGDLTEKI
jgi:hypothetical protein